jgi:hypothetical protein
MFHPRTNWERSIFGFRAKSLNLESYWHDGASLRTGLYSLPLGQCVGQAAMGTARKTTGRDEAKADVFDCVERFYRGGAIRLRTART